MTASTSSSFGGSLDVTKSITSSKTITATTFQGSGSASNSFAGSLILTKGLTATSFQGFFFNATATTEIYPLSPHDALPISTINDADVPDTITASNYLALAGG